MMNSDEEPIKSSESASNMVHESVRSMCQLYVDPVQEKNLCQTYKLKQQGTCLITYLPSDGSDTIYLADTTTDFYQRVLLQIREFQVTERYEEALPKPGTIYGLLEEGILLRAASISANSIRLIDSGDVIAYDEQLKLHKLPRKIRQHPAQAICCRPVGVRHSELHTYEPYAYEVVAIEPQNTLVVQLQCTADTVLSEKLMEELALDADEPIFDPMQMSFNVVPQDDDKICKHYDPVLKGCFKGAKCKLDHVPRNEAGWSRYKVPCDIIPEQQFYPKRGTEVMLLPCNVISVEEFYAHLIPETSELNLLEQMHNAMNTKQQKNKYKMLEALPEELDMVIAQFSEDQQWYRARVDRLVGDKVLVFFGDFGNSELLRKERLRKWETVFSVLPFQAFHCRINNIAALKPNDFAAGKALNSKILDVPIRARVLNLTVPWQVIITDKSGQNIGNALIAEKFAKPRDVMIWTGATMPG